MAYFNAQGQGRVGWKSGVIAPTPVNVSSLWTSIYSVYNADAVGSSSLKTSLVAVYNGESNTNDSFGTNNGTAVGGLTYTTGKIGNAFQFNGSNAYVSIPNTTNQLNFTGDFSISLWVNYNTTAASIEVFLANMKAGGSFGSGYAFYTDTTKMYFELYSQSVNNSFAIPFSPSINTWYHIVATRKRSTETKIYINGALQSGTYSYNNPTLDPTYQSGQEYNIGAYILPQRYFSNIRIDAVNIWQKELTSTEVTELYNSGNGAQYITDSFYKPTTNDALNTYNGTAQGGLTYGVGKVGTAFQFNGSNAYVQLGDVMDVGTSSWSYSYWFNSPNAAANQMVFSKALAGSSIGRVWSSVENNRVSFNFQADSSNIITTQMAASNIANNTWYHVVLVLDRTDKLKMYINGALYPITVFTGTNNLTPYTSTNYNTTHPFRIGAYTSGDNTTPIVFFNGQIDAFNAWNRVLTQSEITELYNSGNGKQYPN
jgi:hypothetical protein